MSRFNHFLRLERLAQQLIEGSLDRALGAGSTVGRIAGRLAKAMEESELEGIAADSYVVRLNTDELNEIPAAKSQTESILADYLSQLAREGGLVLAGQPAVELIPSDNLSRNQILIESGQSGQTSDLTKPRPDLALGRVGSQTTNEAYLIVYGKRHVPLEGPIVNLGRMLDNEIVLDDSTVSRRHAQLQWRHGHYVLYDLGSRAGTLVNGQKVEECVLQAGDVFTLGNVSIIYGEEPRSGQNLLAGSRGGRDDTQPLQYDEQS